MELILRIQYARRIEDYELSRQKEEVTVGAFHASPSGGWHYHCGSQSGQLRPGDVILIDNEKNIAALVLDKPVGRAAYFAWENGITIGRKPGNHIVLKDRLLSSKHCRIIRLDGKWYVEDLGSTNGSFLNDRRVSSAVLKTGDVLKLGRYSFRVGKQLCLVNMDDGVSLSLPEVERTPEDVFGTKAYPWFSPAPRILSPLAPLNISIESAPSIGDKPTMGMGGLALNPAMMAMSLGMQALRYGLSRKKYSKQEQRRSEIYANYLAGVEQQLQEHARQQLEEARRLYPALAECMARINGPMPTLWERHSGDVDFLSFRLGTGDEAAQAHVSIPQQRLQLTEDELDKVPGQLAEKYSRIQNMPVSASLIRDGSCGLMGPRQLTSSMARRVAAQLAALHGYDEVKLIVLFREEEQAQWEWMRWLPHCMDDDRLQRYMICGRQGLKALEPLEQIVKARLDAQNTWMYGQSNASLPYLVFLVAAPELLNNTAIGAALMKNQPELGVSGIFLGERMTDFPHSVRSVVELQGTLRQLSIRLRTGERLRSVTAEDFEPSLEEYDRFARAMAPVRLSSSRQSKQAMPSSIALLEGLGIRSLEQLDLDEYWHSNRPELSLEVPIGVKANGERFCFDIHEKKHGPHGLVAGGTGSGKSQMAHTWIASMALQFSPEEVNFVLVDFKGDSLLQPLKGLPHLAGSISNLDKNVARSFLAMESELERRQEMLSRFQCSDIISYLKKRRGDPRMPAMPYLILIVDEFAEFKNRFPDFSRSLDHLYRGGRSLGLFVILMTQSPAGVVSEQMQANVGFRWCLSVNNESDSREVLGNTDAYSIRNPGRAYVKSGDTYELIQSFFAGAEERRNQARDSSTARVCSVSLTGKRVAYDNPGKSGHSSDRTELDALVDHIRNHCLRHGISPAQPLWQPELPETLELFSLPGQGSEWNAERGWWESIREGHGPTALLGMVDEPARQRQATLDHDFWQDGHLAVYGMPYSGKTTFLQTMMLSLCSRYNPEQLQLYTLEIGGLSLSALETLPHVGAAADDSDPDAVSKIIRLLLDELALRKKRFRREGAGSPGAYAEATGKPISTIILTADNLNLARQAMPDLPNLTSDIIRLAREGMAYGIYLACSFAGSTEVSYQLMQSIKTIYSLQLADKMDYAPIVGRPDGPLPDGIPGRGLAKRLPRPLLFQTAIAYSDLGDSARTRKIRSVAQEMDGAWTGVRPQGILSLADELPFGSLEGEPFILGADLESGESVSVSPEAISLLLSDGAGVKEDLLRSLLRQALALPGVQLGMYTAEPDKYRELLQGHRLYARPEALDQAVEPLAEELRSRQRLLKADPASCFDPIVLIIDGLYDCIQRCQSNTVARLEVFIRLGKRLGVFIVAADSAQLMGKCRFSGDILTETMRQGPTVLVGGKLAEHQILDTYGIQAKYPQPMNANTAIVLKPDSPAVQIRPMNG